MAKFKDWKQKEKVTNAAKKLPDVVKFLDDFSKRALDKRFAQQTELLNARKEGQMANFAVNHLIIRDKPKGNHMYNEKHEQHTSNEEASFNKKF